PTPPLSTTSTSSPAATDPTNSPPRSPRTTRQWRATSARTTSARSVTRDGGAGRRGRRLRFDSAPPSRVPRSAAARGASSALRRRPRLPAALFGPHAYGASFVGTRRSSRRWLSSRHLPRRDEGARRVGPHLRRLEPAPAAGAS